MPIAGNRLQNMKKHLCSGVFVFVLAFSVFGWGLHSKLSLYQPALPEAGTAPIAKLLSEQERPSADLTTTLQFAPLLLSAFAACLVFNTKPRLAAVARPRCEEPPVKPIPFRCNGPSLLRPPPAPFSS